MNFPDFGKIALTISSKLVIVSSISHWELSTYENLPELREIPENYRRSVHSADMSKMIQDHLRDFAKTGWTKGYVGWLPGK